MPNKPSTVSQSASQSTITLQHLERASYLDESHTNAKISVR